jgi:putative SOS response-associated peptidase YedK
MCDRYAFTYNKQKLKEVFPKLVFKTDIKEDYNIAPTDYAPVIYKKAVPQLENMIWGLIPYWKKYGDNNGTLFNARSENISSSISFRLPLRSKRCVIPVQSLYYWIYKEKKKIPFRIYQNNLEHLLIAGIYDIWENNNELKISFSMITSCIVKAEDFYSYRMPLCLNPNEAREWIDEINLNTILKILKKPLALNFISHQITDLINDKSNKTKAVQTEFNNEQLLF